MTKKSIPNLNKVKKKTNPIIHIRENKKFNDFEEIFHPRQLADSGQKLDYALFDGLRDIVSLKLKNNKFEVPPELVEEFDSYLLNYLKIGYVFDFKSKRSKIEEKIEETENFQMKMFNSISALNHRHTLDRFSISLNREILKTHFLSNSKLKDEYFSKTEFNSFIGSLFISTKFSFSINIEEFQALFKRILDEDFDYLEYQSVIKFISKCVSYGIFVQM